MERATALLLVLLAQLRDEWAVDSDLQALETQLRAVGVSAAPGARFRARDATPIDVKGLAIGDKLFVHFVGREISTRLGLDVPEFVKLADGRIAVDERTHSTMGQWVVSTEILRWRLARAVYPLFLGAEQRLHASTSAGAELGRLPEPLLLRIAPFLASVDYCGVTRTNKFLNQFARQPEIWRAYIDRDFPFGVTQPTNQDDVKGRYVQLHEKDKRVKEARRRVWEALPIPDGPRYHLDPYYFRPPSPDILRRPPPPFGW